MAVKEACILRRQSQRWSGLRVELGAPPFQCHRGLDRLNALASHSDGLRERGLEAPIGFDQLRVLIRRGNRRL